jgi:pimeloyl-ACP methyl ester carboxylesterase
MTATKSIEVLPYFQVETLPEKPEKQPVAYTFIRWAFAILGRIFPGQAAKFAYRLFTTPRLRAVHRNSDEVLESARLFEILYGKQILKCYEWGRGEKTVLLVHGWESRGTAMRSFVPGLVGAGFRVVAFDGPAHGNSGGRRTNLPDFAGAVRAVINQVGGVYGIITHSFGGSTSVYALAHLDNSIRVERLVLIAVPASTQKVVAGVMKRMNLPSGAVARFRSMMRAKINGLPFDQTDVLNALAKVKVQDVLVVHDKFDRSVSFESAEAVFERYDHVSLLTTQGWGHYKLMKYPEVVERVVAFVVQDC